MKKNMRHVLLGMSSVIAVALSVAAVSGGHVNAQESGYKIWIGDTEVTASNKDNVLAGDPVNDGKVRYDSRTETLYLDNVVLTDGHEFALLGVSSNKREVGIYSERDSLTIEGSAKISGVETGIWAYDLDYTNDELKGDLDIEASVTGIEVQSANIYADNVNIHITDPEKGIGATAIGELFFSGSNLTVDGAFFGVMNTGRGGVHFTAPGTPDVKITTVGSCVKGDHVEFFAGNIELNQTGDASKFNGLKACAVFADEMYGDSSDAHVKIDSKTNGVIADSIRIESGDFRIKAEDFGLAADTEISISKSYCTTSLEIKAETPIISNYLSLNLDQVKAPKESQFADYGESDYTIIADKDGKPATYVVMNGFDLAYIEEVPATLTEEGCKAYYQSGSAGENKIFSDELGLYEITDRSTLVIPKLTVAMPDVKGMKRDDAKAKIEKFLKDNGLTATINIGYGHNSDPAKNLVVASQSPAAGEAVGIDTKNIDLMVYEGYNPPVVEAKMPDVTGKSRDEAKAAIEKFLKDNGLKATINIGYGHNSDPAKNLLVASQTPEAGAVVDASVKEINLMVYEGYNNPEPTTAEPTPVEPTPVEPTPVEPTTAVPTVTDSEEKGDSEAQINAFVDRIYKFVLGRDPEEEGAAFWADELYGFRRSGAEVAQGFIFSDEFNNRNTTDDEFVTILYKTFFDREADEEGKAYWLQQLSDKTMDRQTVANGFIFSQEWADTCASYGIRSGGDLKSSNDIAPTELTYAFVERMYTTALGREFDSEGREYWAKELANFNVTGEQVGASFFLSEEMKGYELKDDVYLDRLYATFMNREADEEGKAYWLGVMATGVDRSEIVFGFTRSQEFVDKCVEARILPY